jgi:thiol:disulfide interchange protein
LNFIAGFSFIVLACDSAAWSRAEIFSGSSLEQAKQHAQKDGKLFLIDFTASWCPPCKKMESTTWADAAVQAWMKENAVAIQIDVDKDEKISANTK